MSPSSLLKTILFIPTNFIIDKQFLHGAEFLKLPLVDILTT